MITPTASSTGTAPFSSFGTAPVASNVIGTPVVPRNEVTRDLGVDRNARDDGKDTFKIAQ